MGDTMLGFIIAAAPVAEYCAPACFAAGCAVVAVFWARSKPRRQYLRGSRRHAEWRYVCRAIVLGVTVTAGLMVAIGVVSWVEGSELIGFETGSWLAAPGEWYADSGLPGGRLYERYLNWMYFLGADSN
jgi:hypothetical protein